MIVNDHTTFATSANALCFRPNFHRILLHDNVNARLLCNH